ncbi:RdgB/HAM1 family non-canonical purine NTP pyrophosphatase [Thermoproteota archaeon]
MKTIIINSNNTHKITEIKDIFKDMQLEIKAFNEVFTNKFDIQEDGLTFEENAIKKVIPFPLKKDTLYLGDDSGLEVDALEGRPGINSARYAGPNASGKALCEKLLAEMKNISNRKAQFRTVIAIKFPDGHIQTAEGIVMGQITYKMRGEHGFGYDPVFLPEGLSQTFAEIDPSHKNQISHRHLALMKAKEIILKNSLI